MNIDLTVVICTHNRAGLLKETLDSLNQAIKPDNSNIKILVIANACNDTTIDLLEAYQSRKAEMEALALEFAEESRPGKSYALNHAIRLVKNSFHCFVDDDQKVEKNYFIAVASAITKFPESKIFCGPIFPDWTGLEPDWIHETGKYRIFPPPIPVYDLGDKAVVIPDENESLPGGGHVVIQSEVFETTGLFSEDLGPTRHNLTGSEDTEFFMRAIAKGIKIQYIPDIIQYHYVDNDRLKLNYLLKKCYQRNRSITKAHTNSRQKVPNYLWSKLVTNFLNLMLSFNLSKFRFYSLRFTGILGQIVGHLQARQNQQP